MGLYARWMVCRSRCRPVSVVNTSPLSSHIGPSFNRCSACLARWRFKSFITKGAGVMVRALSFFSGAKTYLPPFFRSNWSCLSMRMVPRAKSMQSQHSPMTSPCADP